MRVRTCNCLTLVLSIVMIAVVAAPVRGQGAADTTRGAVIAGAVTDAASGLPVSQVRITIAGTTLRTSTDFTGAFALGPLTPGSYVVTARRIGYEPVTSDTLVVAAGDRASIALAMHPAAFQLSTITVAPGSFSFAGAGAASSQARTRAEIQTAPFGEDLFRAVNRMPGLSSGDYGAQFSIRGGRADETLIILDGLEIYEPYHLKDFAEGALSIVDVENIDGVELLTGGFPARYGDKRSGVMSITSRTPRDDSTRVNVAASFTNTRLLAEGAFAGRRGSWLVSGRQGFADLMLGMIGRKETVAPKYDDAFATVRFQLRPNHKVALSALTASDSYRFGFASTTGVNDTIPTRESANNGYGNSYLWATLQSLFGDYLGVRTLASAGKVTASREGDEHATLQPVEYYGVKGHRNFRFVGLKQDWTYQRFARSIVEWGFDARSLHADFDWTNRVNQDPDAPRPDTTGFYPHVTQKAKTADGRTLGAYLSTRLELFEPLTLELGERFDGATYTHDRDWSPRLHALLQLTDRSTVRGGWGVYRQRQGIADENAFDRLNRYFPSELSRQWTIGFEHRYAGRGSLRAEAYYKQGSHLRPILRNWKAGLNVFPESAEDRILVYPDASTSKGVELYHDGRLGERVDLRVGYALSLVREHITRVDQLNSRQPLKFASTHPAPQDQRHALNLDLTWRPFADWTVASAFTYHTGWPFTHEIGTPVTTRRGQPAISITRDSLYGRRLPDYQRADVHVSWRKVNRYGEWRSFAEVVNLANHVNVLGYDVYARRDANGALHLERDPETWFSILPSLGVSWTKAF